MTRMRQDVGQRSRRWRWTRGNAPTSWQEYLARLLQAVLPAGGAPADEEARMGAPGRFAA